jgi:hypothetical protein
VRKTYLPIYYPSFIENIVVYFLLRRRKKRYGYPFRQIKLITNKDVDEKYQHTIVDVEDYDKLTKYHWQLYGNESKKYYAVRFNDTRITRMHREILNASAGDVVDHRNGNGLDNRKANLRIATIAQNHYNRRKTTRATTSKYKGVHFQRDEKKYRAQIGCKGKRINLGNFNNEIDAAKAYDEAAKLYFGEFAFLNFPQPQKL